MATASSITDIFGRKVTSSPEANVINSKFFMGPDLIKEIVALGLFLNKSPVIRVLNSYKTPIILTYKTYKAPIYLALTSYFSYLFNMKVGWNPCSSKKGAWPF